MGKSRVNSFKIFFLTMFVLALLSQTYLFAEDKDFSLHIVTSCAIDLASYNYYVRNTGLDDKDAQIAAFCTTLGLGFAKEFTDPEFDWIDILADSIGAGIGLGISIKF